MQSTLRKIIFIGIFIVPFIPFLVSSSFFFPFITTKAFAFRIIVEVIFAAWLILAFVDENYRPRKSLITYAVLGFLLIIGIADLFGVVPIKSFWSNFERMEGFVSLLHLGAFFIVIASVFNESLWRKWWNTSLVASFLMVLYCLMQLSGLKVINQGGVRVDGTLGNAIYLAVYMLFHIFIATLFLFREWKKNTTLRWVYGILILSQIFILYFTATRGAIIGLLGGLLIVAILNVRNKESTFARRASITMLSVLILIIGGFFLLRNSDFVRQSPVLSRFSSLTTTELKTQGRYFVWPMAIEGVKERPLLGWGQENFSYVFQKHYKPEMYQLEPWFDRAHNVFLDWAVAGGILGLISYLFLYVAVLYSLWKSTVSHAEKSILAGLVSAYAFHNFFVFDHLVSYILFFALLAYLNSLGNGSLVWQKNLTESQVKKILLPAISVAIIVSLYFINIKPLRGNSFLLEALKSLQLGQQVQASQYFQKAHSASVLGRGEVTEQLAVYSVNILSSDISIEDKNAFFSFARNAVLEKSKNPEFENDARSQLSTGAFLTNFGLFDEGLQHLERARELMPGKQQTYFEIGSVYLSNGDKARALEAFKQAYDLTPEYTEAKIIYLIGAIYAGDRDLENRLIAELSKEVVEGDSRIQAAYKNNGR